MPSYEHIQGLQMLLYFGMFFLICCKDFYIGIILDYIYILVFFDVLKTSQGDGYISKWRKLNKNFLTFKLEYLLCKDFCLALFSEMELGKKMTESLKFLILKASTYIRVSFTQLCHCYWTLMALRASRERVTNDVAMTSIQSCVILTPLPDYWFIPFDLTLFEDNGVERKHFSFRNGLHLIYVLH